VGFLGCVKPAGDGLGLSIIVADIGVLACADDREHEIGTKASGNPNHGSGTPPEAKVRHSMPKLRKSMLPEFHVSLLDRGKAFIDICDLRFVLFNRQSLIQCRAVDLPLKVTQKLPDRAFEVS